MTIQSKPIAAALVEKLNILIRTRLWVQIIAGMLMGIGVGLLLAPSGARWVEPQTAEAIAEWLALPGHLFLALIQMVVIPLVISSIILGIASSGDINFLKRIGLRIAPYFVATTTVAVLIGIGVATFIQPGSYIDKDLVEGIMATAPANELPAAAEKTSLPEKIVGLIPKNVVKATIESAMLEIVIFAILIAVAILSISQKRSRTLLDLLEALQEIAMKVVGWAMLLAPYAVFGLLAQITIKIGLDAILGMSVYVGTVIAGLAILLGFYLLIVLILGGKSPVRFLSAIREPQLLAFSTSSSAAVMPLSMETAEKELGVSPSVSQFIIPLGATVNMDGTALYQVAAAVFLTQVFGVELGTGELILLAGTTVGASIGSPSTPGVGIVILATILQGIGIPAAGIALIIGVDRILDMSRTTVNVTGDLAACVVMEKWIGKKT